MGAISRAARRLQSLLPTRTKVKVLYQNVQRAARGLAASYDAAGTGNETKRHWSHADELSPNAANSADVRNTLRIRARYEVANNSIARGIVNTLANDLVGTCPELQMLTDDADLNRGIERQFGTWADAIRLGDKLRCMRRGKAHDGEAFALIVTNPKVRHDVQLDLRLIEPERVATPNLAELSTDEQKAVDGIVFDTWGNPQTYHVLRKHPGGLGSFAGNKYLQEFDALDAASVLHWYRADRPEQRRGIPDLTPALPLFALLRRFTLATLTAAETAADLAIIMKTTSPAGGEAAEVDPWITMNLERNMAMFAPEGWEPSQLKAEHPGTTFGPFRRALIGEIARCLNMPYCVAAGDSSEYNYASGRMDYQVYDRSQQVERDEAAGCVLDPLLSAWLAEGLRSPLLGLARGLERISFPHEWRWRGREHVDPAKEANAADTLQKAGLLTLAEYCAKKGSDWEDHVRQLGREAEARRAAGLPQPWEKPAGQGGQKAQDEDQAGDEEPARGSNRGAF